MGEVLIENPQGSYGAPAYDLATPGGGASPSCTYRVCLNTGNTTIPAGNWCRPDFSGSTTPDKIFAVVRGVHTTAPAQFVGIAVETLQIGGIGRIVVEGPTLAQAGAAGVVAGNLVWGSQVATDDGELVLAVTPSAGQVAGFALQTVGANALFAMWVTHF